MELTWIGKDERPRLEPRILLEDKERSYHAEHRVSDDDIFDNILIKGDNLLALKALEQEYTGKVKCIYIDPPFNTGNAFEHYDDGVEHSLWLSLMRSRFELLRTLLSNEGFLVVHLDDEEMAYAKILLDEIFGRSNYLNTISMTTNDPSGFKATSSKMFSTANYLLVYAKDRSLVITKKVFIKKGYDEAYKFVLKNREDSYKEWKWESIGEIVAKNLGFENQREAKKSLKSGFLEEVSNFAIQNARHVFRTAALGGGARAKRLLTINESRKSRNEVFVYPDEDLEDFYILNGEQIVFYDKRLTLIDGELIPGQVLTDIWTDLSWTGIASEGSVEFKNGKKPEALLRRVLELYTDAGDLVLDSFGGSGTTAAVAHKMKRRWIMVELGDHCYTHIIPRLKKVIDGEDQGGITKAVDWKGGGGFRFYELAPSLLKKDKWDNYIINPEYNAEMLAEAMCKHLGFKYEPSDSIYWMHGHSTEADFIYVTTQNLTREMLQAISDEVGDERTLLICCKAFRAGKNEFANLTLEKIPNAILKRCEWDKDDYSLQVESLTVKEPEPGTQQGLVFDEE